MAYSKSKYIFAIVLRKHKYIFVSLLFLVIDFQHYLKSLIVERKDTSMLRSQYYGC